ncbi:MAG: ribulose-phosphate 3-epimerase [Bacteroidales bacterium]|nr:ribulose-phosphate 3-epimerase [Bacteroidales bacterium]
MQQKKVAASLLSCDFARLKDEIEMLNNSENDYVHCDVMDGHFVPNISFGQPLIKAVKAHAKQPLDVHLMITDADKYLEEFARLGADIITVHYEACTHLNRTLCTIKQLGKKACVALNPHTPVLLTEDILPLCDMVLLMSVNPGFGGQKFIDNTFSKIRTLKQMIEQKQLQTLIQIDGGVNTDNAAQLYQAGADVLVAGSSVFKSKNPLQTIHNLKN